MGHATLSATTLSALLFCAGCLSLSTDERQRLEKLDRLGYSLKTPPAGFPAPTDEGTAAGLNLLPGIGNIYLANKGAGGLQWFLGAGNFLLWPISPLWSVPAAYHDARTLNQRALVSYWNEHPELSAVTEGTNSPNIVRNADATNSPNQPPSEKAIVPTLPQVPSTPTLPQIPSTPTLPQVPSTPTLQQIPSTPTLPQIPSKSDDALRGQGNPPQAAEIPPKQENPPVSPSLETPAVDSLPPTTEPPSESRLDPLLEAILRP